MTSLQDIVIGTSATRGSQWNIDYYQNSTAPYDNKAFAYRNDAYTTYLAAKSSLRQTFADYKAMGNNPAPPPPRRSRPKLMTLLKAVSSALKSSNSYIQFYKDILTTHNQTTSSVAETALTNLTSYITTTNTHLSSLLSDTTSIKTGKQVSRKTQSLADLTAGPDNLDVRSDQLTIQSAKTRLPMHKIPLLNTRCVRLLPARLRQ